jgi:hypothetical protein
MNSSDPAAASPIVKSVDEFVPVASFELVDGRLHQLWTTPLGVSQLRPVPIVPAADESRTPCVAGWVEEEGDDA